MKGEEKRNNKNKRSSRNNRGMEYKGSEKVTE